VTFQPHGNAHDFKHYPFLWLAAKFMSLLLAGVFAFFWTHSALWFYRSHKERKARDAHRSCMSIRCRMGTSLISSASTSCGGLPILQFC